MCQTPDWSSGDQYLRENATELAPLIEKFSPCTLKPKNETEYFQSITDAKAISAFRQAYYTSIRTRNRQ